MKKITWNRYKQYLYKAKRSSVGCSCLYIKLTNSVGIKFYRTLKERNFSYNAQARAANAGFGPAVGEKITIFKSAHPIARVVDKLFTRNRPYNWYLSDTHGFYGFLTQNVKVTDLTGQQYRLLHNKMRKHKFSTSDIGTSHNVGLLNGNPVCYDFDPVSQQCDS